MNENFQPLGKRLLVKRRERETKAGLLWIPDVSQENSPRATVVAIGPQVRGVQAGDEVLVPGAGNKYPDWESSDYIMIQEADIAGVFASN